MQPNRNKEVKIETKKSRAYGVLQGPKSRETGKCTSNESSLSHGCGWEKKGVSITFSSLYLLYSLHSRCFRAPTACNLSSCWEKKLFDSIVFNLEISYVLFMDIFGTTYQDDCSCLRIVSAIKTPSLICNSN